MLSRAQLAGLRLVAFELLRMRINTESERTAETAVPPKKPPAPSVDRWPRQALPPSRANQ